MAKKESILKELMDKYNKSKEVIEESIQFDIKGSLKKDAKRFLSS